MIRALGPVYMGWFWHPMTVMNDQTLSNLSSNYPQYFALVLRCIPPGYKTAVSIPDILYRFYNIWAKKRNINSMYIFF